jgi:Tfp pilus assembly protein PilO
MLKAAKKNIRLKILENKVNNFKVELRQLLLKFPKDTELQSMIDKFKTIKHDV